jgi:hypothetical protein
MSRLICLAAALGLLWLGACGGDDATTTETGASGATGAQGASSGSDLTAKQFIDASIPDQIREIKGLAQANPDCAAVDTKPGGQFQVGVAISAAQANPSTPLSEIVADQCGNG